MTVREKSIAVRTMSKGDISLEAQARSSRRRAEKKSVHVQKDTEIADGRSGGHGDSQPFLLSQVSRR